MICLNIAYGNRIIKTLQTDKKYLFYSPYKLNSSWFERHINSNLTIKIINQSTYVDYIEHYENITIWVYDNVNGKFTRDGELFIFENIEDAILFELVWG